MTKSQIQEEVGRKAFSQYSQTNSGITHTHFTTWNFERYDGTYYSADTQTFFELKCRNFEVGRFRKEGWLLEKKKYDSLKKLQKENIGSRIMYVNIFFNAVVFWDLTDIEITKWEEKEYRSDNYSTDTEIKEVIYLKIDDFTIGQRMKFNFKDLESAVRIEHANK